MMLSFLYLLACSLLSPRKITVMALAALASLTRWRKRPPVSSDLLRQDLGRFTSTGVVYGVADLIVTVLPESGVSP